MEQETSPLQAPENHNGNGHNADLNPNLEYMRAQIDGSIPDMIKTQNAKSGDGFLTTMMSSITKDEEYRQELKTGFYTSQQKAMEFVLAMAECEACGIPQKEVIDLLIATKAGLNGAFLHELCQTYSHFSFDTNYTQQSKAGKWWNKNKDAASPNSPIA